MEGKKVAIGLAITLLSGGIISYAGTPGTQRWSAFPTSGAVSGSPSAGPSGSPIYITSEDGFLYAINPATGSPASGWSQPVNVHNVTSYGGELISSPTVGCDGTIYVASTDERLYSVNPNHSINWSVLVGHSVVGPDASGALAIGPNGTIYAIWD